VILGGGFGGVAAAHRLKERLRDDVDVTLIDRRGTFMMGLRIIPVLVGLADRASGTRSLEHLTRKGIRYVRDEVRRIDVAGKTVTITTGAVGYDALIIALGAELRPDLVPGFDPTGSKPVRSRAGRGDRRARRPHRSRAPRDRHSGRALQMPPGTVRSRLPH